MRKRTARGSVYRLCQRIPFVSADIVCSSGLFAQINEVLRALRDELVFMINDIEFSF